MCLLRHCVICEEPECCGEGGRQAWRRRTLELLGGALRSGEDASQLYVKGHPRWGANSCNAVVR